MRIPKTHTSPYLCEPVLAVAVTLISILLLLLFIGFGDKAYAADPKHEYQKIQKDIKTQKKQLESTKKKEASVLDELKKTNTELNAIEANLVVQRAKIKKIQAGIAVLQKEIALNKEKLESQSGLLNRRLRALQKLSTQDDATLLIFSEADISQTFRMLRYLSDISEYDRKIIKNYKETVASLNDKQNSLKKLYASLKTEESYLKKAEAALKEKRQERELLLASVRKEKKSFEAMIRELQEASRQLLRIIQESEERERELRKKKRPGKKEIIIEDSEFARHKGRLPWPTTGTVTTQYGTQVDPIFKLPVFRSGIHIKTGLGVNVKTVYEGKVVYADEFKGYGKLVIVGHGSGYHTLYGNLSKIFLKNGDIIKENTVIGETGESMETAVSGLYFELRYKGKPLDPQQWLKR